MYEKPEMVILELEMADVVTLSGNETTTPDNFGNTSAPDEGVF